ncbi:acetate--CoA ligase family protein [Paracoccus aminophilus]|uniref:Acyl-CoA synthetase n=1 Tax=Paracoccus aminophilus JCM 7686 TaxID=1367847 RepID=S5YE77_PARAH|nr:acetate--CoA ligase family protein [Paracoccus aminophilus]AGT09788.1 acyl-CoA synthetase [Paracoccus aminophilus JCM 7686]
MTAPNHPAPTSDISASGLSAARRANLGRLLAPRHILLIGGAQVEGALRNLKRHGYAGEIYVVNPKRAEIGGHPCLRSIAEVPVAPDAVYLGINADATIAALHELAEKGAGGVIAYASGFSELGEAGAARNRALIAASGEMAVVGPNCYGLVNYVNAGSMWPSGYQPLTSGRGAAVIAQSGNVAIHLSANQRAVPFSYLISAGNQAVLGFEDYIDHLADDPHVTAIGLFLEGIRDVPAFAQSCLRASAKGKPVIVCRSGRSELGAAMAASHTSSLAGQNEYYDALFSRLNVMSAETVPQFLELLKLASAAPEIKGLRAAAFSSSGGDNGLAADFLSFAGFTLPPPTPAQTAAIAALLPDYAQVSNPLDFTAGYWGNEALLTPIFTEMLTGEVDFGVMIMDHPHPKVGEDSGEPILAMIRALHAAGKASGKPVFMASVNPESIPEPVRDWMTEIGVTPLQGLHDAAEVLGRWTRYLARRAEHPLPPARLPLLAAPARTVNEGEAKARLAAHGLPVPAGRILTLAELADLPDDLGGRFVLKVLDDRLPHKTEAGGVALNLATRADVVAAAETMVQRVTAHDPRITPERFLLEPMQPAPLAELIIGAKRDPLFGMVLVIGAGGILVELMADAKPLLLPVTRAEVEAALTGLKSFALLDGFRGRPKAALAPIVEAVMAVAAYAEAHGDSLSEIDVNPLMVYPGHVVAVDALIVEG